MVKFPKKLVFGPAGIPLSAKNKSTIEGIKYSYEELKLDGFEMEFVYGVKLKIEEAKEIKEYVEKNDIILTAHAPYYINLNAKEKEKIERSIQMLFNSARITYYAGGVSVVFHPGWYMNSTKEATYNKIKEGLKRVSKLLDEYSLDIYIRPETMEEEKKFGDIDEIINLSKEIDHVLPAIDFAHLRYRHKRNDIEFFRSILEKLEKEFNKEILNNMHIHMSGIKLDKHGTHLNLDESDIPWKDILKLLKEFNVKGIVISESPNIEKDAIMMKEYYEKL